MARVISAPRAGITRHGADHFSRTSCWRKHQLHYDASQFDTAELNGVFYRTPPEEAVKGWKAETHKDSIFAWKAPSS
jgi:uncharacterized protein YecE (DUF72 family)